MKEFIVTDTNDGSCYCSTCTDFFPSSIEHVVDKHKIDPLNLKKKKVGPSFLKEENENEIVCGKTRKWHGIFFFLYQ